MNKMADTASMAEMKNPWMHSQGFCEFLTYSQDSASHEHFHQKHS